MTLDQRPKAAVRRGGLWAEPRVEAAGAAMPTWWLLSARSRLGLHVPARGRRLRRRGMIRALVDHLRQVIAADPFPLSPRPRTLRAILAKLDPVERPPDVAPPPRLPCATRLRCGSASQVERSAGED